MSFPLKWVDDEGLLVSTVFVRRRRCPHHVSGARLANSCGEKPRENGDVQDIAGVDKSPRGRRWKLGEARDGLLGGDKGTVDVDGRSTAQVGQGESEGVVGRGEVSGADCALDTSVWPLEQWWHPLWEKERLGLPL